jgi:REP-associated tyrosine transposase
MNKPKFDPQKHHRKSIRLQGYDSSQAGAYYVTIVTHQRDCLFGEIRNAEMFLNDFGKIADECWRVIPDHFPSVELDAYVIMPNHMHGITVITNGRGTTPALRAGASVYRAPTQEQFQKPVAGSIPTVIRTFKAAVTRRIGREHNASPILWDEDENNPQYIQRN